MMGNSCTSARSAKAPPQDTMEAPLSRCETKEEPTAWCPSSNRLNKKGNYSVPETDAESHAMAPSTTTITLIDGWTTTHTEKLRAAVKDVVAANPILSGKVVAGEGGKGLAIARTEHKTLDPATLNVVAGPSDFEPPADIVARCNYCQDVLGPLAPNLGSPTQQKSSGGPLFNVTLIELPGHRAAYSVSLSRIVGDGWTYYALIDQLNCLINGKALEPLTWDEPNVSKEVDHWSDRDKFRTSKLMIPAAISKMVTGARRTSQFIEIVDHEVISVLKSASRGDAAFVSTNDVVTAAVYETYRNNLAMTYCNLRSEGRLPGLQPRIGGNYDRPVLHPRAPAAGNPDFIRNKIIPPPHVFFGKNEIPFWPMAKCDIGFVNNITSLTKFIVAPNTTVSCHVGHRDLVEIFPLNVTIIGHANPTTLICNHNLKPADLKAAARSAELFPKVFKLPTE